LAEEIHVARNLFLLEYTGGKLHIPTISSAASAALIKLAKAKGLQVSCSVSVSNLVLTDDVLDGFDTRYKLMPPLRSETDRQALLTAVVDGTIDVITSDHQPMDIEGKKLEFDLANYGSIGLESAFGALSSVLPLEIVIEKLTAATHVFGVESSSINIGQKANLTLFNPDMEWIFSEKDILSKSKNAAFLRQKLNGKAYGIFNRNQLVIS
jgi:dihydroorotase